MLKKIKIYGFSGQGVVIATEILSKAVCIYERRYVKTMVAYGHEQRGALIFSDIIIDDVPILLNSFVYDPDIVVIFDSYVIDKSYSLSKIVIKNSILVLNSGIEEDIRTYKRQYHFKQILYIDAFRISLEQTESNIPNGAMLGALANTGIVGIKSIVKSLSMELTGKNNANEKHSKAAQEAYKQVKIL